MSKHSYLLLNDDTVGEVWEQHSKVKCQHFDGSFPQYLHGSCENKTFICSQWKKMSKWWHFCFSVYKPLLSHYSDVIMGATVSQITSLTIVFSAIYSDTDQRKHQSSASLAFVRGIHRGPVNSPHKWPVTRKMFPFDDVIMTPTKSMFRLCMHVYSWRLIGLGRWQLKPLHCLIANVPFVMSVNYVESLCLVRKWLGSD